MIIVNAIASMTFCGGQFSHDAQSSSSSLPLIFLSLCLSMCAYLYGSKSTRIVHIIMIVFSGIDVICYDAIVKLEGYYTSALSTAMCNNPLFHQCKTHQAQMYNNINRKNTHIYIIHTLCSYIHCGNHCCGNFI